MKWPSESIRVQAYHLRKKDPTLTYEQILQRFMDEGKIQSNAKPADRHKPSFPPGNDPLIPRGEPETDITEDLWAKCILRLVNESETMTPAIVDKIRDYLDRKNKITQAALERPRPSLEDTSVLVD